MGKHSRFGDRLRRLGPQIVREVSAEMFASGETIQVDAQISITTGSASGTKTEKHRHVPSRPGEAPNNFTSHLRNNIETTQPAPLHVSVISHAEYSADLEFGTSKMAARPFMVPAAERNRRQIERNLAGAVRRAVERQRR